MKWIKSFFKKAGIEEYNINSRELFDWFIEQTEPAFNEYKEKIASCLQQIRESKDELKEKLIILSEAKLRNENIPEKAKVIMEGNRESYIKFNRMFADSLEIPDETSQDKLAKFVSSFEEKINLLNKNSAKNYYILQEFFSDETKDIAKQLKEMDILVRNLFDKKISETARIKKKINELDLLLENKKQKTSSLNKEKVSLALLDKMIGTTNAQLEVIKRGKQYHELEELIKQKNTLQTKIQNNEKVLSNTFSILEKAMRKYVYLYPEQKQLFESYLTNPINSLLNDANLLIFEGLTQLRNSITTNAIDIKDKERERAILKLNELTRERLQLMLEIHKKIKSQMNDVEKRIRLNNVQREIDESEYKLHHLNEKRIKMGAELDKKEKKSEKTDIKKFVEEIENGINALLDTHINITLPPQDIEENQEKQHENDSEESDETEYKKDEEKDAEDYWGDDKEVEEDENGNKEDESENEEKKEDEENEKD